MAVNQINASNGQITLQGDHVVHHQKAVSFSLQGDRIPEMLKGSHNGDMFITNFKVIFINNGGSGYTSFAMDFQYIRNVEVKQPIFGSNFLKGFIKAEPNGGWVGNANFRIDFPKGGAIDFAEMFKKSVKTSVQLRNNVAPYASPAGLYYPPMPNGGFQGAPPSQPGYYAYQPGMPPQGGPQPLYSAPTGQAPPSYQTAVGGDTNAYPNSVDPQSSASTKAQEAYLSGNNVYVPNNDAPPPYNPDHNKKYE